MRQHHQRICTGFKVESVCNLLLVTHHHSGIGTCQMVNYHMKHSHHILSRSPQVTAAHSVTFNGAAFCHLHAYVCTHHMQLSGCSACWAHVGDVTVLHPCLQEVVCRHLVLALTHLGEACRVCTRTHAGGRLATAVGRGATGYGDWVRLLSGCTCCTVESGEDWGLVLILLLCSE